MRDTVLLCARMNELNKPEIIRLRVAKADSELLNQLGGATLTRNDVASVLVEAAVEAIRQNGGRLSMPLRFHTGDEPAQIRAALPKRKAA